jgi:hypothetical protein
MLVHCYVDLGCTSVSLLPPGKDLLGGRRVDSQTAVPLKRT